MQDADSDLSTRRVSMNGYLAMSTYPDVRRSFNGYISRRSGTAPLDPNLGQDTIFVYVHSTRVVGITSADGSDGDPKQVIGVFGVVMPAPTLPDLVRKKIVAQKNVLTQ